MNLKEFLEMEPRHLTNEELEDAIFYLRDQINRIWPNIKDLAEEVL